MVGGYLLARAVRKSQKDPNRAAALRERKRTQPNKANFGEILVVAVHVIPLTVFFIFASLYAGRWFVTWIERQPPFWAALVLALTALIIAFAAWYLRERRKSRLYPFAEIIFGTFLAAQAAQQIPVISLAGAVAFVGGVRIVIDGFKRFFEHRSFREFSIRRNSFRIRVRYFWRGFKRLSRDSSMEFD